MALSSRDRKLLLVIAIGWGVLLYRCYYYFPFFTDDAWISLRYAHRLLTGHGLTWNDGERVEGYSNLLWVLCVAGLGRLGLELVLAARVLGVVLMMGTLALFVAAFRRSTVHPFAIAVVAVGLAATNTLSVWAIGGLEQPLVACLLMGSVVLLLPWTDEKRQPRHFLMAGVLLGLLTLTRPDGILLAVTLGLAAWMTGAAANTLSMLWPPALCYLGQLAFRLSYYGDWLPNTGRVKLGLSIGHLWYGLQYLKESVTILAPFYLAVPLALWLIRGSAARRRQILLLIPAVAWLLYVLMVGGDVFPGHRQHLPLLLLIAFCGVEVFDAVWTRFRLPTLIASAAWLGGLFYLQSTDIQGWYATTERWEIDGRALGLLLKQSFGPLAPTLAIDAAGCVPYYSDLPAIDMLGLNDRWLATHPPPDANEGAPGHALGNGDYVLSRKPDFIILPDFLSLTPMAGSFSYRGDNEIKENPDFARDYRLLYLYLNDSRSTTAHLWVRWMSPRVGSLQTPDRIVVPGVFFARGHLTTASLDASGNLSTELHEGRSARLTGLPLPRGRWTVRVDATSPVEVSVLGADGAVVASSDTTTHLDVPADSDAAIHVRATHGDTRIRSVTLTRAAAAY